MDIKTAAKWTILLHDLGEHCWHLVTSADAFDRLPARDDPMELCFVQLIGE